MRLTKHYALSIDWHFNNIIKAVSEKLIRVGIIYKIDIMKEKKLSSLVLNKKVISRLNQSFIAGGQLGFDDTLEEVTGLIICTNAPHSKGSCNCTKTIQTLPATTGCNTATDMPTRSGCA